MKIVKYDDYAAEFKDFIHKHNNDFKVETKGHSGEYYNKTYMFEDGAVWYECARKVFETVEIEVHLCKVVAQSKRNRIENTFGGIIFAKLLSCQLKRFCFNILQNFCNKFCC